MFIRNCLSFTCGDSAGTATGFGPDGPGFEFGRKAIFRSRKPTRPAVVPT